MHHIRETFVSGLCYEWQTQIVGAGQLATGGSSLRFSTGGATSEIYTNCQIDDYQGRARSRFFWQPPLTLTVRARFSHAAEVLCGTAGFGFWNDPWLMTDKRLPALPRAIWFFCAAPPSNLKLDIDTPGHGWKVATIDAQRATALCWAPFAPLLVPLMNIKAVYRVLWPHIQHGLRIREATIPVDTTQWHTYALHWGRKRARFSVAEHEAAPSSAILDAPSPGGPLGFVMWQDNQYLVLTPWGRIRWGLSAIPGHQWMEVDQLEIMPIEKSIT